MTNKEALKLIGEIEEDSWNVTTEHIEALNLAIKALESIEENHPCDDCEEQYDCGDCDYRYRGE